MTTLTLSDSFAALLIGIRDKCHCAELLLRASGRNADGIHTAWTVRTAHRYLAPDRPGNYVAFREASGLVSYCPAGREQSLTDDGKWARKGRQDMKPARLVRQTLHPRLAKRLKDSTLNEFATLFKCAEDAACLSICEASFEDAYCQENYRAETFGSCMWDDPVGDFYRAAGAKVMVCKDGTGRLRGRAVFWPQVTFRTLYCGSLLDRIYADSPEVTEFFCQWAAANGHTRKTYQGMGEKRYFTGPDGAEFDCSAEVEPVKNTDYVGFYPYLDTFTWEDGHGTLRNYQTEEGYSYDCTDGSRESIEDEHEGQVQDVNGDWISDDDAREVDGNYYHCDDDRIVMCYQDDEYILRENAYCVDVGGRIGTIYLHEQYVSRA